MIPLATLGFLVLLALILKLANMNIVRHLHLLAERFGVQLRKRMSLGLARDPCISGNAADGWLYIGTFSTVAYQRHVGLYQSTALSVRLKVAQADDFEFGVARRGWPSPKRGEPLPGLRADFNEKFNAATNDANRLGAALTGYEDSLLQLCRGVITLRNGELVYQESGGMIGTARKRERIASTVELLRALVPRLGLRRLQW